MATHLKITYGRKEKGTVEGLNITWPRQVIWPLVLVNDWVNDKLSIIQERKMINLVIILWSQNYIVFYCFIFIYWHRHFHLSRAHMLPWLLRSLVAGIMRRMPWFWLFFRCVILLTFCHKDVYFTVIPKYCLVGLL